MCTSIVVNKKKTIVCWNLDILNMPVRVRSCDQGVYIEVNDPTEGWMPLFGANQRGEFVGMPTCWPYDQRSDPQPEAQNVILLDIDLLLQKRTWNETLSVVWHTPVCSIPGLTFMSSLSNSNGDVLHVVPGQGYSFFRRPPYRILTNFSPYKQNSETHPWMGWDRYQKAEALLRDAKDDFDVSDGFEILRAVAQEVCPTEVSMVFDVSERTVHWCEHRNWQDRQTVRLQKA